MTAAPRRTNEATTTRRNLHMARKVKFSARSENPFFDVMTPAERKWAAGNIRKARKTARKAKRKGKAAGGGS
jgi:hypothetical protein